MFEIGTKRISAIKLSSMSSVSSFARLPAEYQEVEYIESSGTQYINTGFQYTQTTGKVEAKFIPTVLGSNYATYRLAGAFNGSNRSFIMYNGVNPAYIGIGGNDYSTSIAMSANTLYEVVAEITTPGTVNYTLNGNTANVSYTGSLATSKDYLLFCNNENGTPGNYGQYKLFYYKMYETGTLVRDFVPCYRISDGVIGLYDLVNDQFYTNAGSGTFTKGRDILYGINSHTLRYYPFASNVADRAGQGTTGTVNGTVTYSDNGIAVSGDSGYVTGMTNGIANRDTYTQIFRARYSSFPDNNGLLIGDSSNYNTNSSFAFETGGDGSGYFRVYNFIGSGDVIGAAGQDTPRDTYFHLRVMTADHGSYKLYKDGELYLEGTTTGTINNQPNMNLGRSSYYGSQREGYGEVKDYIVEDIPRSAKKIKDFYKMYGFRPGQNTLVYRKLNGDMNDYSGNNRHGTGNITYEQLGNIQVGKFNGGQSVYRDDSAFDIYGSQNYTYSMWIKVTQFGSYRYSFGICESSEYGTQDKSIDIYPAGYASAYIYQSAEKRANSSAGSIVLNTWYNLTATFDGSTLRLYINGQLAGTVATTSSYNFSNPRLVLSRFVNNDCNYFYGYVSEFIFENVAWDEYKVKRCVEAKKHLYGIS